ncbi:hypothetical protein [Deminuibacter soli]|uniref:Lipocalin-like domain-containing protein n=1 Tax=Deminuibacter soli TaxID=2291815 RepID=A0A3E1NFG9_9BACT|nr:hypothetical protein [Deminuibacter soli]RFM26723.1 hypothetical protein DXN05_19340 [Deminuibacter soli]
MQLLKTLLFIAAPVLLAVACNKDHLSDKSINDFNTQTGSWRRIGYASEAGRYVFTPLNEPFYIQLMPNGRCIFSTDTSKECGTWQLKDSTSRQILLVQLAGKPEWSSYIGYQHDTLTLAPLYGINAEISYYLHADHTATPCPQ